jgi:pilus assembly protein CpaE
MAVFLLTSESLNNKDGAEAIETRLLEAKLLTIIPELHRIGNIEDMGGEFASRAQSKNIAIFISPSLTAGSLDDFISLISRYRHRTFFILVSTEISGADYKRLIHTGDAEWVSASGPLEEILELIDKQSVTFNAGPQSNVKPTIISFLPCVGGVGNSTLAMEVALRIKLAKATRSWRMCYVDLDFQTSHVCDYLDIEPRFQISEIIDRPERLDEQLFGLFVSHHKCGLDVFAAPRSKLNPCKIDAAVLEPVLGMILRKYEYIVLDLPVPWFSWTVPTLESSDAIIMTGVNNVACLRQMKVTLDAVQNAKPTSSQVAIVMNRITRHLFGGVERRGHIASVLPNENVFYIEEDGRAVDRVNTGIPAALSGDREKDFATLTSFCSALRQVGEVETAG